MSRVLLLLPTTTYRTGDFLAAAQRLGVDVTVASEKPSTLESLNPAGLLELDFRNPKEASRRALEFARRTPIDAVVGVDDDTVMAAAAIAEALELPHNPAAATLAARHKPTMRSRLAEAGVRQPGFALYRTTDDPARVAREVSYPCVLKPTFLAASRGVIRADDPAECVAAWERVARLLRDPEVVSRGGEWAKEILVEEFVGGFEVALEGLLRHSALSTLALFDKPDPLDGPFFEETIYVTPSRLPDSTQRAIENAAAAAARALGLQHGPVHAELRVGSPGPSLVEIAARSIGGLCSRALRFGAGLSLEEILLKDALGRPLESLERERRAAGVMMIPIPRAGRLVTVSGVEEARAVEAIEDVTISMHQGQRVVPLPEGSAYLGFIFARGESAAAAEASLRRAHAALGFAIR